ncbi:MAG: hypothetical protein ACU84Q_03670 [Gammaproteobacteria bacterium]
MEKIDALTQSVKADFHLRPWWMNGLFYFCVYMTFIYLPFDIFLKPVSTDHEIWLGFALQGWWAKATAPLHWLIYAAGAFGFWKMRYWMWPWAAAYCLQVVVAMFVWNIINPRGAGLLWGLLAAAVFMIPTVALWRAKALFERTPASRVSTSGS